MKKMNKITILLVPLFVASCASANDAAVTKGADVLVQAGVIEQRLEAWKSAKGNIPMEVSRAAMFEDAVGLIYYAQLLAKACSDSAEKRAKETGVSAYYRYLYLQAKYVVSPDLRCSTLRKGLDYVEPAEAASEDVYWIYLAEQYVMCGCTSSEQDLTSVAKKALTRLEAFSVNNDNTRHFYILLARTRRIFSNLDDKTSSSTLIGNSNPGPSKVSGLLSQPPTKFEEEVSGEENLTLWGQGTN